MVLSLCLRANGRTNAPYFGLRPFSCLGRRFRRAVKLVGLTPAMLETLAVERVHTLPEPVSATLDEIRAVVAGVNPGDNLALKRDLAALCFAFLSGARAGAIVSAPLKAIDLPNLTFYQHVQLGVQTKNRKSATTFLLPIDDLLAPVRTWDASVRASLPELPEARRQRFLHAYELSDYDAGVLVAEKPVADYFEAVVRTAPEIAPKVAANWITGTLFGMMNQSGQSIEQQPVQATELAGLLRFLAQGDINQNTAKMVLTEMYASGEPAGLIIERKGLRQVSGQEALQAWARQAIQENPTQVNEYLAGKNNLLNWLFGQAMRLAEGRANPGLLRAELMRQLEERR